MDLQTLLLSSAIILPFPFYYVLWTFPQKWVDICGSSADPSHQMALVSHFLKILQILALLYVARLSVPPWYSVLLIVTGQSLNIKVYHLLGEAGTYYGVRFGKDVPWVTEFPFGYMKDPQYIGSILTLLGCLCWVPWQFVCLWIAAYIFMMVIESHENDSTRVTIQNYKR